MALNKVASIKIHPGIGIARVGTSEEFFVGPEAPGVVADPGGCGGPGPQGGTYRDDKEQLKRQAQRFRIYGYDAGGNVVAELNSDSEGLKSIEWKVHVRNLKAANYAFQGAYLYDPTKLRNPSIQPGLDPEERSQLIIDPGAQTITSGATGTVKLNGTIFEGVGGDQTLPGYLAFNPKQKTPANEPVPVSYCAAEVTLGELALDEKQRLLFVPGFGKSESCTTPRVELGNPSENFDQPNGPNGGTDPLTNQFAYFNVPGWYDDTCGGSIDATVTLADGTVLSTLKDSGAGDASREPTRGGWVVVAPPKYSPWMVHVVTILDRVLETFPEADPTKGQQTEFYRDIYPIFSRAANYAWVSNEAYSGHAPGAKGDLLAPDTLKQLESPDPENEKMRQWVYGLMRNDEADFPPAPPTPAPPPRKSPITELNSKMMPKLWGTGGKPQQNQQLGNDLPNQWLSLTPLQLARLKDWADGNFVTGSPDVPLPVDHLPLAEQPRAMDFGALEPTIGGGFHPGIEFPYLIHYKEFFAEAFRVAADVSPGSLAAYMSSPWQGDFWSCNSSTDPSAPGGWWPVQRPDIVVYYEDGKRMNRDWFRGYDPETGEPLSQNYGYDQMVRVWWQLGMVVPTGGQVKGELIYKESERDPALDKPPCKPTG